MTAFVAASGSLLSQHAAHVLAIGIPAVLVVVGLAWDSWRHRSRRSRESLPASPALLVAAFASVGAAAVHVVVIPEHFGEAAMYGAFFVVAAVCQLGGAVLLVARRSRSLAMLVATGNAAIVLLWIVTRVVGIPIGPEAGVVEPVEGLDVLATTCELVIVVCCLAALRRIARVVRSVPVL
jgi:hypothetical protein